MVLPNNQLGRLANVIRLLAYKWDVRNDKYRNLDNEFNMTGKNQIRRCEPFDDLGLR